jgi:hypothetical protein
MDHRYSCESCLRVAQVVTRKRLIQLAKNHFMTKHLPVEGRIVLKAWAAHRRFQVQLRAKIVRGHSLLN